MTFSKREHRPPKQGSGTRNGFRRGGILLELALALPLLSSLGMGMVEFGRYYEVQTGIEGAARAGGRAGAPWNATISDIQTAVQEAIAGSGLSLASNQYTISVRDSNGLAVSDLANVASGSDFTISVSAAWVNVAGGYRVLGLIGSDKSIKAEVVVRREY